MRDLYSNLAPALALAPAVQSASVDSTAIALQGYGGCVFHLATGAIVGAGDFSAKLIECDTSGGTYTNVDADEVDSDAPATLTASGVFRLGYRGHKAFVKLALTKAGGTSIAASAVAVRHPLTRPVA
jgi:hypothetical protein